MAHALRDVACGLRDEIRRVLPPLLRGERRCALVDFPAYANVGDNVIWLGTRRLLRECGIDLAYASDARHFSETALRRRLPPGGRVLLSGGGNLGDLWPESQRFRESLLRALPDYRVLQLPQTIRFRDAAALARARSAFRSHPDLTLLVRDAPSAQLAERELGLPALVCPDLAFALGPLPRPGRPAADVAWLLRTDQESAQGELPPDAAALRRDWLDDERPTLRRVQDELARWVRRHPRSPAPIHRGLLAVQDACARRRLRRGAALLARGEVVVSDRLHGHVLCVLLGIPHVCLGDAHGKLRAFLERWTGACEDVAFAVSPAEAAERARALRAPAAGGRRAA